MTTRPLTEDELAELKSLVRRVNWKPILISIPLTLWFWPVFAVSLVERRFPSELFGRFSLFLLGAVTIYWEWQVITGYALARRLRDDWAGGTVEVRPAGEEALPVSGMDWTVGGAPAPWRGLPPGPAS